MPSIRIGFSTDQTYYDFILDSGCVGVGTTVGINTSFMISVPQGTIKSDFNVIGVTTLASYGGFIAQQQHITKSSTIGFGTVGLQTAGVTTTFQYYETEIGFTGLGGEYHGDDQYFNTLSEDLVIDDGKILNIANTEMVGVTTIGEHDPHTHASHLCAGLEQVSVTGHFSVPNGGINERKENPVEGTVRFNTDLNTLEFFNGVEWRQFTYNSGGDRGVWGGGYGPGNTDNTQVMDYVTLSTTGNAESFGDLNAGGGGKGSMGGDGTRGLFMGGIWPAPSNTAQIDYITIPSGGNGQDFGDLTNTNTWFNKGASSSTRAIRFGGSPATTRIDYVEIQTTGDAIEFGALTVARHGASVIGSPITAIAAGGNDSGTRHSVIEKVTISSKGNGVDIGDLGMQTTQGAGGISNGVRGIFSGGYGPSGSGSGTANERSRIDFFNIASTGTVTYFGELTRTNVQHAGTSSKTRGVFGGGRSSPLQEKYMEYITISTAGNAIDFGDLTLPRRALDAVSNCHGGLGGF